MTDTATTEQLLEVIGLDEKEILVYIEAVKLSNASALELSNATGIPRSSIYRVCESLVAKGFMMSSNIGGSELYIARAVSDLAHIVEQLKLRAEITERSIDTLKGRDLEYAPVIYQVIDSEQDYRKHINNLCSDVTVLYIVIADHHPIKDLFTNKLIKNLNRVEIKAISNNNLSLGKVKQPGSPIRSSKLISGNGMIHISGQFPGIKGLFVEDQDIVKTELKLFERIWE